MQYFGNVLVRILVVLDWSDKRVWHDKKMKVPKEPLDRKRKLPIALLSLEYWRVFEIISLFEE